MRLHLCRLVVLLLVLEENRQQLGARLPMGTQAALVVAQELPAIGEQPEIFQEDAERPLSSTHLTNHSSYKSQSNLSHIKRLFKRSLSEEKLTKKTREFLADAADISARDLERGTGCSHKSRRLIGYVTSWSGRPLTLKLASRYTNLIYAFARLNADGSVSLPDDQQRLLELLAARDALASRGHNLSISLAVGGWTYSEHFSSVLADTTKRGAFIGNISALLSTKNGFDGIDIDWEYRTTGGLVPSNRVEYRANYVSFVRELRTQLPAGKLISIPGASAERALRGFDIAKLIESLDWFGVTTYDFTGALDTKSGAFVVPNAPLRHAAPPGYSGKLNAHWAIKQYVCRSGQPSKIVLGLPFFGRFLDKTSPGIWDERSSTAWALDEATTSVLTYDSAESIAAKVQYALEYNLGGVMAWTVDADDDAMTLTQQIGNMCAPANRTSTDAIKSLKCDPLGRSEYKESDVGRIKRAADNHNDEYFFMYIIYIIIGLGIAVSPILFMILLIACCYKVAFFVGFERNRERKARVVYREGEFESEQDRYYAAAYNANLQRNIFMSTRPKQTLSWLIKPVEEVPCNDYICKPGNLGYNNLPPVDNELMSILVDQKILIERSRLTLGHLLGLGQFGRVHKGFLKAEGRTGQHTPVAVKTPQKKTDWSNITDNRAFLEEGLIMKDFDHENVLALIGVSFEASGLPMVITPFMLHGDLKSFLLESWSKLTLTELIGFGVQIARGMAHLSNRKFVHRDLAARNCMLDEKRVVKVADFGLSRDIYGSDYYASCDKATKLPVKWMAIESLKEAIYTTKSDVWSYGVVLWELTTGCIVPYPDVDSFDVLSFLEEGRRMLRPRLCPVSVYEIMLSCWKIVPAERPSFDELVVLVSNVIPQNQAVKIDEHKR